MDIVRRIIARSAERSSPRQYDVLRREYEGDGVSIVRAAFSAPEVKAISEGWLTLRQQIASGVVDRNARFLTGALPKPLAEIYKHHTLVKIAQTLIGSENIALYMNRILIKDRDWSDSVSAHQDLPYFSGGQTKVSIFVPLTRMIARNGNGGLIFIKGSHKYGVLERGKIRLEVFAPMDEIAPDVEVGDIVVMDFLTWHYSDNAVVVEDRPIMQIVYQPSSDGSYGAVVGGVFEPTLVSGRWLTSYFAPCRGTTIPDP